MKPTLLTVCAKMSPATPNLGFAPAASEFGMLSRKSQFKGQATWATAKDLATRYRGADLDGYRADLARLIELASALDAQNLTSPQRRR
jgi:Ca-activated chloride channel homolog